MFEANGWVKFVEEDTYANGCVGKPQCVSDRQMRFSGHTLDDLISALMEFTGVETRDALLLDACDEEGRLDIQVYETEEGYPALKRDIEKWKEGERRLWLAEYSFKIERVERHLVRLAA